MSAEQKANYVATDTRKMVESKLKSSIYKHTAGKEPREQKNTWYKVSSTASCYLSQNLKCSSKFIVIPSKAGNGSALAVFDIAKPGRSETPFCLKGHKAPITCFDMSHLDPGLVVSGSQDGQVNIWNIPEGGLTADITEPSSSFNVPGKVTVCRLSQVVSGLLVVGSTAGTSHSVHLWDIGAKTMLQDIEGFHNDTVTDIQFDDRANLLATVSKDRRVRVLDIRGQETVAEIEIKEGLRDTMLCWVSADILLVMGTGSQSQRSLSLWNVREKKCLKTLNIDKSSSTFITHYDRDMNLLFVANNGSTSMQLFEVTASEPFINNLSGIQTYSSPDLFQGLCFMPKLSALNVKEVKVAHAFKLSQDKIIPIEWRVPRKRLEFFQDDIFPNTWDGKALCNATEWFAGKNPQGADKTKISLKPADMELLSNAPAEELTERQLRYAAHVNKKDEPKKKGALGHESAEEVSEYFTQVAKQMPKTNRFDAVYDEASKDVDEDEWD